MTDQYDKICPLLPTRQYEAERKCRGQKCAFANIKHKSTMDEDGKIRIEPAGWYCLVRDFLITMAIRE